VETAVVRCPGHADWKTLYRAAISEGQRAAIADRVSEAERAVLARGREVLCSGGAPEEKEALEDALYILHAFQNRLATGCE